MSDSFITFKRLRWWLCLSLTTGCIEPFEPKVAEGQTGFLVVDGSINAQGVSMVRLSHTIAVNQNATAPGETKASVYIEQQGGARYILKESPAGTYTSPALSLPPEQNVRLHFTLANGREYASDFVPAKVTPAIDSFTWKAGVQGLQVSVNSHDDKSLSRYYRWTHDETWEFTSAYPSVLEFKNEKFIFRTDNIYRCWSSESSTAIKLGTTIKLAQDVVSHQPLTLLPQTSVKLRFKYSILVKQYALSPEEYQYWEALRKNTENIGTLFDPLPTQLTGNVHNLSDPVETVIGFVGAQSVTEKRIFIDRSQLPDDWRMSTGYETCASDTFPHVNDPMPRPEPDEIRQFFRNAPVLVISEFKLPKDTMKVYYVYATPDCVDCRKRGTNVRPSFWQ